MIWDWLRRRPLLIDTVLAAALLAGYLGAAVHHRHDVALGVLLALAQSGTVLARRFYPVLVLALVTAAAIGWIFVFRDWIPIAPALAVYTVAAHRPRRMSLRTSALTVAALAGPALWLEHDFLLAASRMIPLAAAWILGDSVRTRRAYTAELEAKADRLEREREQESRRAAAEEQARIARELHDVIAHNVSVMVVLASAGNDVFDRDSGRAREALRSIESTGRAALGELRRLLGVVRSDGSAEYAPQPGIDRLPELVEQVRAAGLPTELEIAGRPRPLPLGIDLSAYRIVQEALTNTLKHAEASHAKVRVRYDDASIAVEIDDDGRGSNGATPGGHGLIGMRERVTLAGGELNTGRRINGGFSVSARFPLDGAS
jgi:signal transduction histidine kinase